jgi:hypothetical protein
MNIISALNAAFGLSPHIQAAIQQLIPAQSAKVKHSRVTGIAKAKRAARKARRSRK